VGGAILTAAGVSDAEMDLMTDKQRLEAKRDFVQTVLVPAGQEYVDELVRRFRIATLRHLERSFAHIPVALARQGVVRAIMSQFELADAAYHWLSKDGDKWLRAKGDNTDRERRTTGLSWTHASGQRVLMLGEHDPASEDLCYVYVFACHYQAVGASVHLEQLPCIAFGVVAAGLDPTGFCEHWKTARSALTRIRDAFTKNDAAPSTFFVANGIAKSMADEIWRDLENGVLTNAANLTKADQVSLLARWLIGL
jgi:type II restriction enzyme